MFGTTELLLILLIIIIVFGASKLPQLGDALGKSIRNFRQSVKNGEESNDEDNNQQTIESSSIDEDKGE